MTRSVSRLPLAWAQSRDTMCLATHLALGSIENELRFLDWVFRQGCVIRGKYSETGRLVDAMVTTISCLLTGEKAIQWLSERLPVSFTDYAVQMFDALYRSRRGVCQIGWGNGKGVRLFRQHRVYVYGLDFERNMIQIAFRKRQRHGEEEADNTEHIVKEYPMPSDENEVVRSLKVRWGDLLRSFAVCAIITLHHNELVQHVNKSIRGKENIVLLNVDIYDDIVVGEENYPVDLTYEEADNVYLKFGFEQHYLQYYFMRSLKIAFSGNVMDLESFLTMPGYYSPLKGEGILYQMANRAFVVSLSGNSDEVRLEWKDAWISLHRNKISGQYLVIRGTNLYIPLSVKHELVERSRLSSDTL